MSKLQIDNSHFSFRSMLKSDVVSVMEIERTIYEFPWTAGNFNDCLESGYQCDILIFTNEIIGYAVQITGPIQCLITVIHFDGSDDLTPTRLTD